MKCFRAMLSGVSYAIYSCICPVGKAQKHLIIYPVPSSLKINVRRHFVFISMLNTGDGDLKHVSLFDISCFLFTEIDIALALNL